MSFDRIDRQFRPKKKPKIELECEVCHRATPDVETHFDPGLSNTGTPLCAHCYSEWKYGLIAPW